MKKISAKNVEEGMIFRVISHDKELDYIGFEVNGMLLGKSMQVKPSIGMELQIVKKAHRINGSQRINWKAVGSEEIWSSYWSIFKRNTELVSNQ